METDQNFIVQDDKKWDRPWTTDEIRKNSANWTLAGDVGLYNLLTEFSQNIISRTHEVENVVDSLVYKTKMAGAKINNVINDFHMLSNLQFVENRVYDEEIQEPKPETKPVEKTKEQKEAEMLPKIIKAVELGLQVLDQAFNKINVNEISDSEDEDLSSEGRTILEPKDPYESRPLPFIIGSEEFQNSEYAGLQDLLEEDFDYSGEVEGSISDSDETSSEEEEPLPLDAGKFTGTMKQPTQDLSESDKFSSSEESELFGSEKEENGFISDSSFGSRMKEEKVKQQSNEEIKSVGKESRQSSVSTIQSKLDLTKVLLVDKKPEKEKDSDDLFANDEDISEDESPFRKKTGLFSSDLRFDDDKDMFDGGDLFGEKPKEIKKAVESHKPQPTKKSPTETAQKKKEEPVLFGDDEDSEDDIFNTLIKTKAPTAKKESFSYKRIGTALPGLTSTKSKDSIFEDSPEKISPQDTSEKTDSASTPSSALSIKSSGNAFDMAGGGGTTDSLFGDESDADDLFSSKRTQKKFDFNAEQDDEDDLFGLMTGSGSKKSQVSGDKKSDSEKKSSLFEESDGENKSYKKIGTALPGLTATKSKDSKIEDRSTEKLHKIGQPLPGLVSKKADSIFEDSDNSEQEDKFAISPVQLAPAPKKKDISLFDDDADDDIFSQVPKKLMSPGESPSLTNKTGKSQFDKIQNAGTSVKTEQKDNSLSLFDDDDDDFEKDFKSKSSVVANKKPKDLSLFEESDNFDLFSPKTEQKPAKVAAPIQVHGVIKDISIPTVSDEIDSVSSSKTVPDPIKEATLAKASVQKDDNLSDAKNEKPTSSNKTLDSADSFIGFDTPADSTKTLHVLSKDRAKISAKRRKPTKKGRLAALGSNDQENTVSDVATPPLKNAAMEDDLFVTTQKEPPPTTESPSMTHKAQEKKKMSLMSQLMSEAAAKKVGKNALQQKQEEEEEEVDIFAEASNKDRTKSRGFSFLSPIESSAAPDFVKEDEKEAASVLSPEDADNDDFFAEPSFQNFRSSISHKDSILNMDDDDDEDDLFSTTKTSVLPKSKLESSDTDIFADDSDIFADIQKEKYEMFPSNVYDDDEDDDIFSSVDPIGSEKSGNSLSKITSSVSVKKEAEKKPVNVFEDPLTGLLGDD